MIDSRREAFQIELADTFSTAAPTGVTVPSSLVNLILAYTFEWRLVSAGANDPTIKVWDIATSEMERVECVREMTGHTDGICCASVLKGM